MDDFVSALKDGDPGVFVGSTKNGLSLSVERIGCGRGFR